MSRLSLRQRFRQRRFPPEFRIPLVYGLPGLVPLGDGERAGTERGAARPAPADAIPAPVPDASPAAPEAIAPQPPDSAMADLATNLWRLDKKLADGQDNGVRSGAQRKAARHLRAAQDALVAAGVETQDHDGMEFTMGLSLDVLAYQPAPGATRQTVLETVRPSVFRHGRAIQIGQVIVIRPEGDQDYDA